MTTGWPRLLRQVSAYGAVMACAGCASGAGTTVPWTEASSDSLPAGSAPLDGTIATGSSSAPAVASPAATSADTGGSASSVSTGTGTESTDVVEQCSTPSPGRSPLRRLTRFEYSNTLESLLNESTKQGQKLPAELLGNGFANDADAQPTSAFLIEQYAGIASDVAARASSSDQVLGRYGACVATATAETETECFQTFVSAFAPAAYRRPLIAGELEELIALQQDLRAFGDFRTSVSGVVEALLQSPDFLYRLERGESDAQGYTRLTGPEMATRLSYFLWGAPPDDELKQAALDGALNDATGVLAQAQRLLNDPKARQLVQFFFESTLPINALSEQTRDPVQYPEFNAEIGALMYEETWRFLDYEIFSGPGTWNSVLTAPYTFLNEPLANYYGVAGVTGEEFRKVDIDVSKRLGLLTQGGIMTGTTVSNVTNPVRRGGFLLDHILCVEVPLPPSELAARATPPEPYTGSTGRERYSKHSQDAVCGTCHALLDPPGFALENFDAVGRWRDQENDVTIDASGNLSLLGQFSGPVEMVQLIAENEATHQCFASEWQTFAYGRHLDSADACNRTTLQQAFATSGHNVRQLLLDITQTHGFLYLGEQE